MHLFIFAQFQDAVTLWDSEEMNEFWMNYELEMIWMKATVP